MSFGRATSSAVRWLSNMMLLQPPFGGVFMQLDCSLCSRGCVLAEKFQASCGLRIDCTLDASVPTIAKAPAAASSILLPVIVLPLLQVCHECMPSMEIKLSQSILMLHFLVMQAGPGNYGRQRTLC